MSLPSQSARGGGRSGAVSSRRRRKSTVKSALPFLLVAVLVVIVWFTMRPTGVRQDEPAAPPVTDTGLADAEPVRIAQNGPRNPGLSGPPRALPGSQEPAPDEVDRALLSDARSDRSQDTSNQRVQNPVQPAVQPQGQAETQPNPRSAQDGGVITRALDQTAPQGRPTTTPQATQPNNQPDTRPSQTAPASRVRVQIDTARRLVSENDRVGARALLSRVLREPSLTPDEAGQLRDELTVINNELVLGRVIEPSDPLTEEYQVQPNDSLSRIASRREVATHWKLIQRVNGLSDPRRIAVGQRLKLVRGPFHAVVSKRDYRMDVWHGPPSDPSRWVYIRSFDVGLGEADGTPLGSFVVSSNKLENPGWVNPRDSRERYEPNDPKNPIGDFWLGLDGQGEYAGITGYGIHGTIDPDSIGQSVSMGCIRLRDEDIALVFELLAERVSRVEIVP